MTGRGGGRRHPLVERFGYYLARGWAWWRRATPLGLTLRVLVWLTGAGGLLLAGSTGLVAVPVPTVLAVAVVLAIPPAIAPHTRAVSLLAGLAIALFAGWLLVAPSYQSQLLLAAVLGGLLYLHHAAAALAAQVRTDAVVPAGVLRHWVSRVGLVLAVSTLAGGLVVGLPAPATGGAGYLLLGAVLVLALTGMLVLLARHRRAAPQDRL